MRALQGVFAAAIFLGCATAEATASPRIAMPSDAFLHANSSIDAIRWRHRHSRGFSWGGRGDTDGFSSSTVTRGLNSAVPPAGSEIFRLDVPRRRGWVDPPPPR